MLQLRLRESLRALPVVLATLFVVVTAVDILLAWQPALLQTLSHDWQGWVSARGYTQSSADLLAAAVSVASVVVTSAVLMAFAQAVRAAPHASVLPVWVGLCMLTLSRMHAEVPLPMAAPAFAAFSALLMIGAGTIMRLGGQPGLFGGALLLALPLLMLGVGYLNASGANAARYAWTHDAQLFVAVLALSAIGVALIAVVRAVLPSARRESDEVPGLEGVDVVEELFAQVERAERSEARVAELEQQLRTLAAGRPAQPRTLHGR
jgi:hypothetical protein